LKAFKLMEEMGIDLDNSRSEAFRCRSSARVFKPLYAADVGNGMIVMREIEGHRILIPGTFVSISSNLAIWEKFRAMKIHKRRKPIVELARELNPLIDATIQYFHKFWEAGKRDVRNQLNHKLLKCLKWEKGMNKYASWRWLGKRYRDNPALFTHWRLVQP